ncbi:MAG: RNA polymerase sigma factor [Planctomycetota bacterium]|jgi:RNA polymerase sigma-70 factor (ECF subfamily)
MNPSFEELLAHGAFLRGLACALLRDEQGAEDVVQDTYVAALRRPPARHAPGAWLAVVARNLARRRRRTELRRGQRERATARTEGLPSTAEVAAQVELQEKVAAAVGALGEPYRSAVVLRFYYGRTPTEIAGEQGIPVETVKTQLKRAIQMLRARLDRTIGERAWAPLLTVLVTERAGIPMGVVLMTKKSVLAVVAVLLLVGLTFLFLVQNDSPAPERVSAARGAAPVLERPPSGSESEAEVPRKGRGAAPGEAGSSVAGRDETTIAKQPMVSKSTRGGRIISERGGVVPGVHVVIEVDRHRTVVFSSADGTIEVLQEMPKGSMRVGFATWPAKENYYLRTAVPVFEGIEQDADGAPTLRFEGIAGQVLDPDGKPASEGFVVARLESDRTIVAHAPIAGSGWFAFYGLREGEFHLSYKPKSIYSGEHAVEGGWGRRRAPRAAFASRNSSLAQPIASRSGPQDTCPNRARFRRERRMFVSTSIRDSRRQAGSSIPTERRRASVSSSSGLKTADRSGAIRPLTRRGDSISAVSRRERSSCGPFRAATSGSGGFAPATAMSR